MRMCEAPKCNNVVFGTDKKTRIGYCKNHQYLRTDIDKRSILQKAVAKHSVNKKLNSLKNLPENKEMVEAVMSKAEMLKLADSLFSDFIINRDKDSKGNIQCVCCGKVFNVLQTSNKFYVKEEFSDNKNNNKGDKIVQCLHFIDRDVYSLRFDEDNAHAGCGYCNFDMFKNKGGIAYRKYHQFMITEYGEDVVAEMALQHRKINKLDTQMLTNIIEHYGG